MKSVNCFKSILIGSLFFGIAFLIRLALSPLSNNVPPFITFFPAVAFATWFAGPIAGFIGSLFGLFGAIYFMNTPFTATLIALFMYILNCTLLIWLGNIARSTIQEIEQLVIKRTEELKNSSQFLQRIIDLVPVGIFWKDKNSLYLGCNKFHASQAGLKPEDTIGKDDIQLGWQQNADQYVSDDQYVINNNKPLLNIIEPHDNLVVRTSKVPFLDASGQIIGVLGCWLDITEQTQLTEDLQHSNEELNKFAYVASHDLKAPLRAISNLATWITEDIAKNKNVDQYVETLHNRILRMEALINGLLELSRIGRVHTDKEPIKVEEILNNIVAPYPFKIITLMPTVFGNKIRLSQVFSNLINNAFKHHPSPDQANVTVACQEFKNYYKFSVKDDGTGINPKFHKKIFEIFQTMRPKDEIESTGIGLSIVKKIIEEMNGDILLDSDLGEGATFIFTWPKT